MVSDTDTHEDVDPAPKVKEPRKRVTKLEQNQLNDGNDAAPISKIKAAPRVSLRIRAGREDVGDAPAKSGPMSEVSPIVFLSGSDMYLTGHFPSETNPVPSGMPLWRLRGTCSHLPRRRATGLTQNTRWPGQEARSG